MSDDLNNSHEERIQRVEGSLTDVATQLGELGATHKHIIEKLDIGFKDLHEGQARITEQVKPLIAKDIRSVARWELAKKLIFPAIAAAAGVFGSKFSAQILHLFGFN